MSDPGEDAPWRAAAPPAACRRDPYRNRTRPIFDKIADAFRTTPWIIAVLILACVGVEAVLVLGDLQVLGTPRFRGLAYEYGGFWAGLLHDWKANYALQPYTMFLTYAFLHGGPVHLTVNMISLWSLGCAVHDRVGTWGFALLYGGSVLGGAVGFGLLSTKALPMVGASGGLFGLVGGILAWNYIDRFHAVRTVWPVFRMICLLVLLNVVLWWAMDGLLAWETHLGGFVFGWVAALLIDPRSQEER